MDPTMDRTPPSLLIRLRQPAEQAEAWARFVELYGPLLLYWVRRCVPEQDAHDVVQQVFARLVEKLPQFQYQPGRRFRGWLYTITRHCLVDHLRRRVKQPAVGAAALDDVAVPDPIDEIEDAEYRQMLVRRALEVMQAEFARTTWKACWLVAVEGKTGAEAAAALGISENAVYVARSRVLRRLREELEGLLD
jgi:RNA polymerase sigma-70 factor (ECF subfamily)